MNTSCLPWQRPRRLISRWILLACLGAALLIDSAVLAAQQVAAASRELTLYLPITEQQHPELQQQLGHHFEQAGLGELRIVTADYWHDYQWALRKGKAGLYYAAPHFLAWSLHQHNFTPLLRIAEPLKYVIATRASNLNVFEISDLNKRTVCAQRALNLDYLLINSAFDNRLHSANVKPVWSVVEQMTDAASPCVAFSLSDHYFIEQELAQPGEFIRLQQGPSYNNYGFVLHPTLAPSYREPLIEFFSNPEIQTLLQPLLRQTATKAVLTEAKAADYPRAYLRPLLTYWRQ